MITTPENTVDAHALLLISAIAAGLLALALACACALLLAGAIELRPSMTALTFPLTSYDELGNPVP